MPGFMADFEADMARPHGVSASGSLRSLSTSTFTANGAFTPVPGTQVIVIAAKAADGGSGATSYASGSGNYKVGGPAGTGATAVTSLSAAGVATLSVAVGAGGAQGIYGVNQPGNGGALTVSNGATVVCSCGGGAGGTNAGDPNSGANGSPGAGGATGVGTFTAPGVTGGGAQSYSGPNNVSGSAGTAGLAQIICLG